MAYRFERGGVAQVSCPRCSEPLQLDVEGPDRSVGIMGPTIVGVIGACAHVAHWQGCLDADSLEATEPLYDALERFEGQLADAWAPDEGGEA